MFNFIDISRDLEASLVTNKKGEKFFTALCTRQARGIVRDTTGSMVNDKWFTSL